MPIEKYLETKKGRFSKQLSEKTGFLVSLIYDDYEIYREWKAEKNHELKR